MSRSNPTSNNPHPCTRWFEYKGGEGHFQWYDREKETNVKVKLPFTFIVLDRTATIRGYSKKLQAGFYSNEVRDTRSDVLVVKNFKSGPVAKGIWSDIKDKVTVMGGKFCTNVYIAFKDNAKSPLQLGCIQMQGCCLGPWFDFEKEAKKELYEKAVVIKKVVDGEPVGDIEFKLPVFELTEATDATNKAALKLDLELQEFFKEYFSRNTVERAHPAERSQADAPDDANQTPHGGGHSEPVDEPPPDDDVPF